MHLMWGWLRLPELRQGLPERASCHSLVELSSRFTADTTMLSSFVFHVVGDPFMRHENSGVRLVRLSLVVRDLDWESSRFPSRLDFAVYIQVR